MRGRLAKGLRNLAGTVWCGWSAGIRYSLPVLRPSCKYYPSCSQYAIDALRQYGFSRRGYGRLAATALQSSELRRLRSVERQTLLFLGQIDICRKALIPAATVVVATILWAVERPGIDPASTHSPTIYL